MKENKSYFAIHSRDIASWFLIDTNQTLKTKTYHNVCISMHTKCVVDIDTPLKMGVLRYINGIDDLLPHPTISDYFKASDILRTSGKVYNKKRGVVEERKSL